VGGRAAQPHSHVREIAVNCLRVPCRSCYIRTEELLHRGAREMSTARGGLPRRSPPRRLSASPEGDSRPRRRLSGSPDGDSSPTAHRDRRHSSKEDLLSALGGRNGSLSSSPRNSIDAAASVPLPLPAPAAAARGGARPAMKPMRRPPRRPDVATSEPEPEPEREPACDDGIEPWLREAQLLEAAIGTCARVFLELESPRV
jgi:hypothetical protein